MDTHQAPPPIQFDSVADLYDSYVKTDFDIPFWLQQSKSVPGKVLELTCGTGRVSIPLLEAGVQLSCVDYAPEMLAQFRRKLTEKRLTCSVYCQDMAQLNLPDRYDLIFIPFHSFSEITDPDKQRSALKRILSHLTDRGTFICTLQNPIVRTSSMDGTLRSIGQFPLPEGRTLKLSAKMTYDSTTHIASGEQLYELCSTQNVCVQRRTLAINFSLFHKQEFESLLHNAGFVVEELFGDYESHPFSEATSPFMIWKLKRAASSVNI